MPEKLPGVARTAGKYFGRLKRFVSTVKSDVEQELRADELRDILSKQQEELNSLKDSISDSGKAIEDEVSAAVKIRATLRSRGASGHECCNPQDRRYRRQIHGDSLSHFIPVVPVDRHT